MVKQSDNSRTRVLILRILTGSLAVGLAMVFAGCYTMLRHPVDDLDLRTQDESCSRCHFYDDDGQTPIYYIDDYYVNSDYPWINYYDSNWWSPVRWERYDPPNRDQQRQRGDDKLLVADDEIRTRIRPQRWRPVSRSTEAESLRLSIAHRFPNPGVRAPGSASYGSRMGSIGAPEIIGGPGGSSRAKSNERQTIEAGEEIRTRTRPSRESAEENDATDETTLDTDTVKPGKERPEVSDRDGETPTDPAANPPVATPEPEKDKTPALERDPAADPVPVNPTGMQPLPTETPQQAKSSPATPDPKSKPEPKKEEPPRTTPKRK